MQFYKPKRELRSIWTENLCNRVENLKKTCISAFWHSRQYFTCSKGDRVRMNICVFDIGFFFLWTALDFICCYFFPRLFSALLLASAWWLSMAVVLKYQGWLSSATFTWAQRSAQQFIIIAIGSWSDLGKMSEVRTGRILNGCQKGSQNITSTYGHHEKNIEFITSGRRPRVINLIFFSWWP